MDSGLVAFARPRNDAHVSPPATPSSSPGGGRSPRAARRGGVIARASALRVPAPPRTPPRAPAVRDPPPAGEGEAVRPRDALRARVLPTKATNFCLQQIRGGRAPKGANEWAASSDAARAERSALAFRRPTAALASAICRSSIQAALRAMQCAGVTCALASRLSEVPRAPVIMPAGSMPGPPESGSDEPPPAGTALAPSVGVTG